MFGFFNDTHERPIKNCVIGIAGTAGSFSEEAALKFASEMSLTNPQLRYLVSTNKVLGWLEAGNLHYAVFPYVNSTTIVIQELLDAIGAHRFKPDTAFSIPVRHNIIVRPGVRKCDVRVIVSQRPALDQCARHLSDEWPGVETRTHEDTAKAAFDLANGNLEENAAVIASARAAQLNGLNILKAEIQDSPDNATYFIVARRLVMQRR